MSSGALEFQGLQQSYQYLCQCLPRSGHAEEGGRKIRRKCLIPRGPDREWFRLPRPHPREAANNSGVRDIARGAVSRWSGLPVGFVHPTGPSSPQILLGHLRFKFWLCFQLAVCLWNKPFDHSGFQLPHQQHEGIEPPCNYDTHGSLVVSLGLTMPYFHLEAF